MKNKCCNICEEWKKHCYWEHFPKRKKFIKVLTGDFLSCLNIPKKFTSCFKEKLSKTINLKGPSDRTWPVGLKNIKGTVFLCDGWNEFVVAHHLKEEDILLFTYEGKSFFDVKKFDSSDHEKKSSSFDEKHTVEQEASEVNSQAQNCFVKSMKQETTEVKSQDVLGSVAPIAPKVEHNYSSSSSPCGHTLASRYRREHEIQSPNVYRNKPRKEVLSSGIKKNKSSQKSFLPKRRPATNAEKGSALDLALKFQSSRPKFLQVMRHYNVRGYLDIPKDFARRFLPKSNATVIIRLGNGNEWRINYRVAARGCTFVGKWHAFVRDNLIEEGDAIVFELSETENEKCIMTPHFFRAVK